MENISIFEKPSEYNITICVFYSLLGDLTLIITCINFFFFFNASTKEPLSDMFTIVLNQQTDKPNKQKQRERREREILLAF